MVVRDMSGSTSFYACMPKAWAQNNLENTKYVEITMLSDGSLRIVPEVINE